MTSPDMLEITTKFIHCIFLEEKNALKSTAWCNPLSLGESRTATTGSLTNGGETSTRTVYERQLSCREMQHARTVAL